MMKTIPTGATFLAFLLSATVAFAEGGYYSGTLGARAAGRGGADVVSASDVTAVSANPAGLSRLDSTVVQVGNVFSYNAYEFTREARDPSSGDPQKENTLGKVKNGTPWQGLDPFVGFASHLGHPDWAFALAAYAPPGIAKLEFPQDGGQRYMMVSREAMILKYVASAAWKYHDIFGVGATAEWIHVPRLRYSLVIDGSVTAGAANPISSGYDILATANGSSLFTFNAVLGAWYRPVPFLEFGASGQVVPANVVASSSLTVDPLDKTTLPRVDLTRNGAKANDVTVTLPLPMLFRSGVRYRHLAGNREVFDLELDVEYETWSRVNQFTIQTNGLQAKSPVDPGPINLNTITIDKHWRDTVAVRLGGDYAVIPSRLTLRAGGYYESAVADGAYADVDFPSGAQIGGALGASIFFGRWEVAFAYHLRVQPSVYSSERNARVYQQVPGSKCVADDSGNARDANGNQLPYTNPDACNQNYLGQPSPAINAGTYSAMSHSWAIDVLYRH